jgi:integrase
MTMIKSTGIFYIKKDGSTTGRWNVYYQHFTDGKRKQEAVKKYAYQELGFRPDMDLDEAKARCKQLNSERSIEKQKVRLAASRVVELKILDETIFPKDQVTTFLERLEDENFGSDAHLNKILSHFNFIQKMLISLKLVSPMTYKDDAKRIYKYFFRQKVSVNYAKRLLSLLNRWGRFQAKLRGSYYEDVPAPRGRERSAISEAQQTKRGKDSELGVRTESSPLSPEILSKMKDKVSEEHYNWLYLSLWLGLRPEEVDSLHIQTSFKVETRNKVKVLSIYQSKLMSIPEPKRWKHIPLIFKEQASVVEIIKSGKFKRPHSKTVRKHSGDNRLTLYAGRKAFVDLCLDRGQDFVDIASWMGHKDTSTTFRHYKNRDTVRHSPVVEVKTTKRRLSIV